MTKFRIIKVEAINGKNDTKVHYIIQRKFLLWFFNYGITIHYFTYTDWNAHYRNMPCHMAMLTKRVLLFDTKSIAIEYLNKIKNPFVERYKGNKIIRVFDDKGNDIYINKSYQGVWSGGVGYEYSNSIEEIKRMIDQRKVKTKITIIYK